MHQNTDLTIDGADEIDAKLDCIKGGGGCHLQEKLIAYCAKKFVLIADSRKKSFKLGENWPYGVPIEVLPSAYKIIQLAIEKRYGGKSILRESSVPRTKAGPVITDNGNFIIDWIFENNDEETYDWKSVNTFIKMIPGVIETGCEHKYFLKKVVGAFKFFFHFFKVFIEMAHLAYFGMEDGTVTVLKRK
jgi:ribose 5-phosphate isomerase A